MQRIAARLAAVVAATTTGVAATAVRPTLTLKPKFVTRQGTIRITGTHFRPRLRVTLYLRQPPRLQKTRIATTRAGRRGGFTFRYRLPQSLTSGRHVVVACQRSCRVKATALFTVAKLKPQ